jgi:hypothetical protein
MMLRHRVAFDNDPEKWNNLLEQSKSIAGENHYHLANEISSTWEAKFQEEYDL